MKQRLTVKDVALVLQRSERFVTDELRRKNLRGSKVARNWLVDEADLERYLDAQANVTRVRRAS